MRGASPSAKGPDPRVGGRGGGRQGADGRRRGVDRGAPACTDQVEAVRTILRERRVTLTDRWELAGECAAAAGEGAEDPFALRLPALLLANKVEFLVDADAEPRAFLEVTGLRYPALNVSAATGQGLGTIGPWLLSHRWRRPRLPQGPRPP